MVYDTDIHLTPVLQTPYIPQFDDPENTLTIIVPLANPHTASTLLHLANMLVCDESKSGHLVVLIVTTPDSDPQSMRQLEQNIKAFKQWENPCAMTLIQECADQIADGILKVVQDSRPNMVLLGMHDPARGQVEIGHTAGRIADAAPCDVLIYRNGYEQRFKRIVVPVGGSVASTTTMNAAAMLSRGAHLPIQILHVRGPYRPEWESQARIEHILPQKLLHADIDTRIVSGFDEAAGVLAHTNEHDLLVIGKSRRSELEKWLYGDTAKRILDRATGPVLFVVHAADQHRRQPLPLRQQLTRLRPLLTDEEQEQIVLHAHDTASPSLDYIVLISVAAMLASLGLLLNSATVVIGAMLVAPLMGPIISLAVGLTVAHPRLVRQSVITIALGFMVAFLIGILAGIAMSPNAPTPEIIARGFPSLLDAGVALAAGFVAAYATARKGIPAALAGVAIAAALVPPVVAFGIDLAMGEIRLGLGAALLFVTNFFFITIVGIAVFSLLGLRPKRPTPNTLRHYYQRLLIVIIFVVPVIFMLLDLGRRPSADRIIEPELDAIFAPAELTDIKMVSDDPLIVEVVVNSSEDLQPGTVIVAQEKVSSDLGQPVELRVVIRRTINVPRLGSVVE